jgi:hypothetical protein
MSAVTSSTGGMPYYLEIGIKTSHTGFTKNLSTRKGMA